MLSFPKLVVAVWLSSLSFVGFASDSGEVVGRVGVAQYSSPIFIRPNIRSVVRCRVVAGEKLAVRSASNSGWLRVLLSDGSYGFIPHHAVTVLAADLRRKKGQLEVSSYQPLASRSAVATFAQRFIGSPYQWGGEDVLGGIDCSGFVKRMYGSIGASLPRTAAEQALVGTPILRLENLEPGDRLYFWERKRGKVGHTGIYVGGGYFVHSSSSHHGVAKDYLGSPKWLRILYSARR